MNHETVSKTLFLLGKRLKYTRKVVRDQTQKEFSTDTGIGPNHIGAIENGNKNIQADTMLKLRYAGLDISQILDEIIEELINEGKDIIDDND